MKSFQATASLLYAIIAGIQYAQGAGTSLRGLQDDCVNEEGKFLVDGFKLPRSCIALNNNNACDNDFTDGSGKVFEKCRLACKACDRPSPPTAAPVEVPIGCVNEQGRFDVEGFQNPRSCVALGNLGACLNDFVDGSGKVYEKCPVTCDACLGPPPTPSPVDDGGCKDEVGKFEVDGLNVPRSCIAIKNTGFCDAELIDGSGKAFGVCQKSCDACNKPPTEAPKPIPDDCVDEEGKFDVEGFQEPRSCVALGNNKGCLNDFVDGSGKVYQKCPRVCDACFKRPNTCKDAEGKFFVVGFKEPRSCVALALKNSCGNEFQDGSGRVSEKCPVSCEADCTESPTMEPTLGFSSSPSEPPSMGATGSPTVKPTAAPTVSSSEAPSEALSASLSPSSTAEDTPDKTVESTAGETSEERLLSFQLEEGSTKDGFLAKLRKPFKN